MTPVGRLSASWSELADAALDAALKHTDPKSIAAVYLSSFAPGPLCGIDNPIAELAGGLRGRFGGWQAPIHGPFLTGGSALYRALCDLDAGRTRGPVVVLGVEKMTHLAAGEAAGLLAPRVVHPAEHAHGATLPALAALATLAYERTTRVPRAAMDAVAVKNHEHACNNPLAQFQVAVTREDVARSPRICDPLRRLHCAPMSDGAAACVIGSSIPSRQGDSAGGSAGGSRASRIDVAGGVTLRGWAHGRDAPLFHARSRPDRFEAASRAARVAFDMAGRHARDVDVVEIHDAFSPFELMNLEAMGFFEEGKAWRALIRGDLHTGGRVAVNPSGGMKGRGHPIGVCGLSSVYEVCAQLTHEAGPRQHPGARRAVIQSAGGVASDTFVFVAEGDA